MNRQLTDIEVEDAIAKRLPWHGQSLIEELREMTDPRKMHATGRVVLTAAQLRVLIADSDQRQDVVTELAYEARASRSNTLVAQSIPRPPKGRCGSCRSGAPLLSLRGDVPPVEQAIPDDRIACRLNPALLRVLGVQAEPTSVTSYFTPMHRDQGCLQWQAIEDEGFAAASDGAR